VSSDPEFEATIRTLAGPLPQEPRLAPQAVAAEQAPTPATVEDTADPAPGTTAVADAVTDDTTGVADAATDDTPSDDTPSDDTVVLQDDRDGSDPR
jgi:hypothetical protein